MKLVTDIELTNVETTYLRKNNSTDYGMWKVKVDGKMKSLARYIAQSVLGRDIPLYITIDHIDKDTSNNYLSNLRFSTEKLNSNNVETNTLNVIEKYKNNKRFEYGSSKYSNRVVTPKFSVDNLDNVPSIFNHFYYLCCGELLVKYSEVDETNFTTIFRDDAHREKWFKKYLPRMNKNVELINAQMKIVQDFSGHPFGTTLEKIVS